LLTSPNASGAMSSAKQHETRHLLPALRTTAMHSKRHRRERQRRAAIKFRRAFRRDIEDNGGILRVPDRFRNYVAMCRWFAKAQRQAQKITLTNQPNK